MAVILNLFAPAVWQSLESSSVAAGAATADAQVINDAPDRRQILGWCAGCPFAHVCGDECALTDDFMSNPSLSGTVFRNLNEFITFKKHFGWG